MRIRLWNAFASNNSGSYTIVGRFSSSAVAEEVAGELAVLMRQQTDWIESREEADPSPSTAEASPLYAFVQKHGLTWEADMGTRDDWPSYSEDNAPRAVAVEREVVVHHDYTVTLPRVFGQYFYARQGRVEQELNHAHHPIVAVCEMWMPWSRRKDADAEGKRGRTLAALTADDGPLTLLASPYIEPAWQVSTEFMVPDITVGAVFDDLVEGLAEVTTIARAHELETRTRLFESFPRTDSLAFLRPSQPLLPDASWSVILESLAPDPPDQKPIAAQRLSHPLRSLLYGDEKQAEALLASLPAVLRTGLTSARAAVLATRLRSLGANVIVRDQAKR